MRNNQFIKYTCLSFFSVLGVIGAFSLLFCLQSVTAHTCLENGSAYTSGTFKNDIAAVGSNIRRPHFSGRKTLTSGGNPTEYLLNDSSFDLNCFLLTDKNQVITSYFNPNCAIISCTAPPRAGPFSI